MTCRQTTRYSPQRSQAMSYLLQIVTSEFTIIIIRWPAYRAYIRPARAMCFSPTDDAVGVLGFPNIRDSNDECADTWILDVDNNNDCCAKSHGFFELTATFSGAIATKAKLVPIRHILRGCSKLCVIV